MREILCTVLTTIRQLTRLIEFVVLKLKAYFKTKALAVCFGEKNNYEKRLTGSPFE